MLQISIGSDCSDNLQILMKGWQGNTRLSWETDKWHKIGEVGIESVAY